MELIRKVILPEIKEVRGKERTLEFIGSTETKDRVGDIIEVAGWNIKDYKNNPVFLWAHNYDQPPIGRATKVWKSDGRLKFQIEFADAETYEFADTIFKLYKGGFLSAVSVGFDPREWEDIEQKGDDDWGKGRRYKKQDLLELSAVPVPANAEALVNARDTGLITVKEFRSVTKPEETDDYIRIPVAECSITATIDISKDEGIKALYCGKEKKIATYLFAKDKGWTMEEAKEWVKEHSKSVITMETTTTWDDNVVVTGFVNNDDEIVITRAVPELVETDWDFIRAVLDINERQIPDDILLKAGAVLSVKNKDDLIEAKRRIDNVLAGAQKLPEEPEDSKDKEQIKKPGIWTKLGVNLMEDE